MVGVLEGDLEMRQRTGDPQAACRDLEGVEG